MSLCLWIFKALSKKMVILFLVLALAGNTEAVNLLKNPDFEDIGGWKCYINKFKCYLSEDKHDGNYSWYITGRNLSSHNPFQEVELVPGTRYRASAYIKVVNDTTNELYHTVRIQLKYPSRETVPVAVHPRVVADKWTYLDGNFIHPSDGPTSAQYQFIGPIGGASLILDSAVLEVLPENTNWRSESDAVIDRIRKQDMKFSVSTTTRMRPSDVKLEIKQIKHGFPFGAMVKAEELLNDNLLKYRNYLYNHMFNWATVNDVKWKQTEKIKDQIDYNTSIVAIQELKKHGFKVRGHTLLWSNKDKNPDWVQTLTGQYLKDAISTRLTGILTALKGMVDQYDVINENLHGQFYETQVNDADYHLDIYKKAHQTDPDTPLYSNDFGVINFGTYTQAYLDYVQELQNAKVGINGIGAQSHFKKCPDPSLIKLRLDRLAQANLPIFITEHNMKKIFTNATEKADCLEKSMRSFFGHPAVKGIIVWGFWDGNTIAPQGALVDGPEFIQNEAGDRFMQLMEDEWRTHINRTFSEGKKFTVRAFKGKYLVRVTNDDTVLMEKEVTLGESPIKVYLKCGRRCRSKMS